MQLNSDFKDLLLELNAANVDYIVVGAFALGIHGMPRYTGDLDIFYKPSADNADKILLALERFGIVSPDLTVEDLIKAEAVFFFGHPPARIDFLNEISGVSWKDASASRVPVAVDGVSTHVLSLELLAQNKKATGQTKDLAYLELIEKCLRSGD